MHPSKALRPISVTEDGIMIRDNEVQQRKSLFLIMETNGGMFIVTINVQLAKASSNISTTDKGIDRSYNAEQSEKADS